MFKTWFKNVPKVILAYFGTVLGKRKNAIRRREYQESKGLYAGSLRKDAPKQHSKLRSRIEFRGFPWISGKRQAMSGHSRFSGPGPKTIRRGRCHVHPATLWFWLPQPVQVTKVGVIFAIEDIAKPGQVQKHSGSCYQVLASEIAHS